MQDIRRN